MMDPVAKQEWVEALRSGEYQQATTVLCAQDGKMCCLGVLYDVAVDGVWDVDVYPTYGELDNGDDVAEWNWAIKVKNKDSRGDWYESNSTDLPEKLLDKLGITEEQQQTLISMNDVQRKRFPSIANWIEKNL